jgi:diaminopimelate epimerase
MDFYKYEGTGNDFVIIDDRDFKFPTADTALVAKLCNRRFGIGADGLILLQEKAGLPYMKYFNSDGQESSMCGNGGRCFARFMHELGTIGEEAFFEAIDGIHAVKLDFDSQQVALKMIDVTQITALEEGVYELNTGSPHYVQFKSENVKELPIVELAKAIRYNSNYGESGINVNFANLVGLKEITIRTYERGVEDETLSCGTGATAVALAAAKFIGLPEGNHALAVKVEGGDLTIRFYYDENKGQFSNIWLVGPANQVFKGKIDLKIS